MASESQKENARRIGKLYGGRKPRTLEQLEQAFWSRVVKNPGNGCWIWQGAKNKESEYGQFCWFGKVGPAHKFAYITKVGPVENGLFVCHSCDNPPCVRPSHLFKGTALDNNRDCINKGRNSTPPRFAVLTDSQAKRVAKLFKPFKITGPMLARQFEVPLHVIRSVLYGKAWKPLHNVRPLPKKIRTPKGGWHQTF